MCYGITAGYRGNSNAEHAEMKGKRLNTTTLKQLCFTDKIHAERKFEATFKFTPSHILVIYSKYKPEISANYTDFEEKLSLSHSTHKLAVITTSKIIQIIF